MEKIKKLFILLVLSLSTTIMAQERKMLTLEELIPGGVANHQFRPENIYGLQWWGDICIKPEVDSLLAINPVNGKETVLITRKKVNEVLNSFIIPADSTKEVKQAEDSLQHFYNTSFLWADKPYMLIKQPARYMVYDFKKNELIESRMLKEGSDNIDYSPESGNIAYTIANNLFVNDVAITDEPEDVVCGQAVHRNEFGIMKGTFWSPDGKSLAFYRMDQSMVTDYPLVDISERIATLNKIKYPMAGMNSHKVTVGVYQLSTGKTVYLESGDSTDRYFTNISWSSDGKKIYMIELNRDQNHAQLVRYDALSGKRETVLLEERDAKYVEPLHPILFVKGNEKQFIYQSQADGFNHLYLYETDGKPLRQLTSGNWLVQEVLGFDEKGKYLFFTSTEESPLESRLYKLDLKSGKRILLTQEKGVHQVKVSPSGSYFIDNYSSANVPRVINMADTKKGKVLQNLLTAKNPFDGYDMPTIETGTIKAADKTTDLYYRMVKPSDFDPNKKYPVIVYVYGGPHVQMIHNKFNWDVRGWDIYMAQKGYIMFTLDNRGSDNRGRDFEKVTFRQLGIEEGKDQVKGVEFLKSFPYVDGSRIGIHGWSYGGHMTTALMLRYPELFSVGVAGGPVIDWKYYEIMYGERYMDMPDTNPKGYEVTNLNNQAKNLRGRLLIIHDDSDHTCVLQHTLSFMQACVEAYTYPDLFIYPGHDHNVIGRDRVHLYEKITRYFEDYLK